MCAKSIVMNLMVVPSFKVDVEIAVPVTTMVFDSCVGVVVVLG